MHAERVHRAASKCLPTLPAWLRDPVRQPARVRFVSPDWIIDNFQLNRDPPRRKPDVETEVAFDDTGDGETDGVEGVRLYDLALVHRRNQARIEVRTTPMTGTWADADPRVIGRTWVETLAYARVDQATTSAWMNVDFTTASSASATASVGGASWGAAAGVGVSESTGVSAGADQSHSTTVEQRYSTRVVEEVALTVGGRPAWSITFDFAELNQLALSQGRNYRRVRLIFVRTALAWSREIRRRGRTVNYPVLMVIAYSSRPEEFDRNLPSLERLLGLIRLGRQTPRR